MRCEVCGLDYGLTHNCPGAVAAAHESLPPPPDIQFAPLRYLKLGWEVARLQERAIRTAAQDNNCFLYGVFFFLGSVTVIALSEILRGKSVEGAPLTAILIGLFLMGNVVVLWQLAFFAICHVIAKKFLGGAGKFLPILRPLALTSFLFVFAAIPGVGAIIVGIWWTMGHSLHRV